MPADPCESEVLKLPRLRSPRVILSLSTEMKPECLISASSRWAECLGVRPIIPFQALLAEEKL